MDSVGNFILSCLCERYVAFSNAATFFQDIASYKLGSPKSFHYLNQSSCYELEGVNDAHEYLATRRAMDIVGINEEEQVSNFLSRPFMGLTILQ